MRTILILIALIAAFAAGALSGRQSAPIGTIEFAENGVLENATIRGARIVVSGDGGRFSNLTME